MSADLHAVPRELRPLVDALSGPRRRGDLSRHPILIPTLLGKLAREHKEEA
ncbi:hypothetical protein [Corynebacterium neomassiliense]|uniref:hypothetical protein n=1 Tax=Corynebacterium neomassiliense TaxID=2079482 RepID=UPI0013875AEF|nr:hypothetical protein [Corynebacterium neomassiliense]